MKKILKKSIIISMITLFSSFLIAAVIGFISRNTLVSVNVDSVFFRIDENRKVNDYIGVIFGVGCLAVLSSVFFVVCIKGNAINKIKTFGNIPSETKTALIINKKVSNMYFNDIPLRI